MPLEPEMAAMLNAAGLGQDAVWQHKQSKQWIVYHWALEEVAARREIVLDPPHVVTADPANKTAVICVTGRLGDHVEWSFGEAAPYNTTQTYPFAMAEKRAKDRVILKLLKLHGRFYSEEEADTFKANGEYAPQPVTDSKPAPEHGAARGPLTITDLKKKMGEFAADLPECRETETLEGCLRGYKAVLEQCERDLPSWWFGNPKQPDVSGFKDRIEAQRQIAERSAA